MSKTGRLTTHVLDTALGKPAAGLKIDLFQIVNEERQPVTSAVTNDDGRVDAPLLDGAGFTAGTYELLFHAGDYLRASGAAVTEPAFLDRIPLRFGVADPASHYHVPLLLSAYSYSTYRGS